MHSILHKTVVKNLDEDKFSSRKEWKYALGICFLVNLLGGFYRFDL